jgi:hypothetical protein
VQDVFGLGFGSQMRAHKSPEPGFVGSIETLDHPSMAMAEAGYADRRLRRRACPLRVNPFRSDRRECRDHRLVSTRESNEQLNGRQVNFLDTNSLWPAVAADVVAEEEVAGFFSGRVLEASA